MSNDLVRRGVRITIDQNKYNAIISAMNNINGRSAEFVLAHGSNNAARKIKPMIEKKIAKVYQSPWAESTPSRTQLLKANVRNTTAVIDFRSELPDITKFRYLPHKTPTIFVKTPPYKLHKLQVLDKATGKRKTIYRMLGPQRKYTVIVSHLRGDSTILPNAFVQTFKNKSDDQSKWHEFVGFRNKKGSKMRTYNGRLPLVKVLGSSDMVMASNEKTYGAVEPKIGDIVLNEVMKQFYKAIFNQKIK